MFIDIDKSRSLFRKEVNNMVYVTWNDGDTEPNVQSFPNYEEAEDFVKENGLSMEENVCEMSC